MTHLCVYGIVLSLFNQPASHRNFLTDMDIWGMRNVSTSSIGKHVWKVWFISKWMLSKSDWIPMDLAYPMTSLTLYDLIQHFVMCLFETWVSKSLHCIGNASNNSAGVAVSLKNDLLRTMHSRMGLEWAGFRIYSGPSRCEAFLVFPPEMSQKLLRFVRIVQSGSIFVHY